MTAIPDWTPSTAYAANDVVVQNGALWRRIAAGNSGGLFNITEKINWTKLTPDETAAPITVYLDGTNGLDTNSGDANNPVKTLVTAYARLPDRILHRCLIDIVDAGSPYDVASFNKELVRAPVMVSASVVTEVVASQTVGASTTAARIESPTALTKNEHRGLWLEVTTNGETSLVQIAWNDTTFLYPDAPIVDVPDATSTYRIIRPAVAIQGPAASPPGTPGANLARGINGGVSGALNDDSLEPFGLSALHFHMVKFQAVGGAGSTQLEVEASRVVFWGCEAGAADLVVWATSEDSQIMMGTGGPENAESQTPFEFGLAPTKRAWRGAGLFGGPLFFFAGIEDLQGYVCFNQQGFAGRTFEIMGGSCDAPTGGNVDGALHFRAGVRGQFRANPDTPFKLFMGVASLRTHVGVRVEADARVIFTQFDIEFDNPTSGIGFLATTESLHERMFPGRISLGDNVRVNGGPDFLVAAVNGGEVWAKEPIQFDTDPREGQLVILPVQVTDQPLAFLDNLNFFEGAGLRDPSRGSVIQRAS